MAQAPGKGRAFPATRHSVLEAARSPDPEERRRAFGVLVASYWTPVYKYLRLRWRQSAEDAAQRAVPLTRRSSVTPNMVPAAATRMAITPATWTG